MVDGVHGLVSHVVRLVVVELKVVLDHVTIPHVYAEAKIVQEEVSLMNNVTIFVVLVR